MQRLPGELRDLVRESVTILGQAIKDQHGLRVYEKVEELRQAMLPLKRERAGESERLLSVYAQMKRWKTGDLWKCAHAFACMLELINRCENAYRSYRIQSEADPSRHSSQVDAGGVVTFVLTAHPTEARSKHAVTIFNKIQAALGDRLRGRTTNSQAELRFLLTLALQVPLSRTKKPAVQDEAEFVYGAFFREDVFGEWVNQLVAGRKMSVHSWVGGDKDGHPGVTEAAMLKSLATSRSHLVAYIGRELDQVLDYFNQLENKKSFGRQFKLRQTAVKAFLKSLLSVKRKMGAGDARRVLMLHKRYAVLKTSLERDFGGEVPGLTRVEQIFRNFPYLVMPLELREDSELVHKALTDKSETIYKMLKVIKILSGTRPPNHYARSLILSMCGSAQDLTAGRKLVEKVWGTQSLPVVPLFETQQALEDSSKIVKDYLSSPGAVEFYRKKWEGNFEVMLGYSDSSKQSGSLKSRLLIYESVFSLEKTLSKLNLRPIFFHGSGGSVARGGGSLRDQVAWWPLSCLENYKATIQGEMIPRLFSSPEILSRSLERIHGALKERSVHRRSYAPSSSLMGLANGARDHYRRAVENTEFLEVVKRATPYSYLSVLKMGSRPSKRKALETVDSLRAIPWILCWTQTRLLFPTWWGLGSSWKSMSPSDKTALKELFESSEFFRTYVQLVGFTLAKVEMPIWEFYLCYSDLSPSLKEKWKKTVRREHQATLRFFHEVTGQRDLLYFRPWLAESIRHRSPMIHPLNLMQKLALEREDQVLLSETVTGVAIGMLTTG